MKPEPKEGRFNDIYEGEAIGPFLVLHHWGAELAGCLWFHVMDNAAATLVQGACSVHCDERISGLTWSHVVGLGCSPWFDPVKKSSNPIDGLSRGRLWGPWVLDRSIRPPCGLWDEAP